MDSPNANNNIKEQLSLAYLRTLAARNGFTFYEATRLDDGDGLDVIVKVPGKLDSQSTVHSPQLDLQVKATTQKRFRKSQGEDRFSYSLKVKNYNDLRLKNTVCRLLVVVVLPENLDRWVECNEEKLILRKCAYWCNLSGRESTTNSDSVTIEIPEANLLTPDSLRLLMHRISIEEDIGYEL
jgi:hypothetical protein